MIGLALGCGSARGWAHIGVIRALQEKGIFPRVIAGTSIGALVGAVHAAGRLDVLEDVVGRLKWRDLMAFVDVVLPRGGFIDGKRVSEFIRACAGVGRIEDLELPFGAVCTDITTGKEVVLKKGDLALAVQASIAIPGVFTPVRWRGKFLVDGGLVDPVPVGVLRKMGADFVIAVDLNHGIVHPPGKAASPEGVGREKGKKKDEQEGGTRKGGSGEKRQRSGGVLESLNRKLMKVSLPSREHAGAWRKKRKDHFPGLFDVLAAALNIMEIQITQARFELEAPDILIRPPLAHIRFLEFTRGREAIRLGYEAAMAALEDFGGAR